MLFLKAIVLAALIKLLIETENPLLCAALYTGIGTVLNLAFERPMGYVAVGAAIMFAFSYGYFWLLDRLGGSSLFWVVLVLGLLIGIV